MQARTAGELRAPRDVVLPPVQMELFTEAGSIVAERAVNARAGREVVAGILRRAAEQAGRVVSLRNEISGAVAAPAPP